MTFEQLSIFVAVAERQHLTRAAQAIGLTPSAVSASIKALEAFYGVRLFERVGRGIELTQAGRLFLPEAKATLARANAAAIVLSELGALKRGVLEICASQTIASYWLPQRLMRFHEIYPDVELRLALGNTRIATQSVLEGSAEIGFVEGTIDEPALTTTHLADDQMVVVVAADNPIADRRITDIGQFIAETSWVMREKGSGTRSEFEAALATLSCDPADLNIAFDLPSNEAVLHALEDSRSAAAVSRIAAAAMIDSGKVRVIDIALPTRAFMAVRHKERRESAAARELRKICTL